jgi:type I restriction enzyme S subunit
LAKARRSVGELMADCDYGTSQKSKQEGRGIVVLRMGGVTSTGELDLENLRQSSFQNTSFPSSNYNVLFNRTNSRELVGKTGM